MSGGCLTLELKHLKCNQRLFLSFSFPFPSFLPSLSFFFFSFLLSSFSLALSFLVFLAQSFREHALLIERLGTSHWRLTRGWGDIFFLRVK